MHNRIDFMSEQSEVNRVSTIIKQIVKKVDYGRELNKTLDVYTNTRGLFINLDQVTECLI